jgi:hypothetical protein
VKLRVDIESWQTAVTGIRDLASQQRSILQHTGRRCARSIPNSEFTQVIFRLPNTLPSGTCAATIFAHGRQSNSGTFRIAQ